VRVIAHVGGVPVEEIVAWILPSLGATAWTVRMALGRRLREARRDPDAGGSDVPRG
jgi:hypothetical protein